MEYFQLAINTYKKEKKKKIGNETNLTVVIFSVMLIGPRVLGDSFIRHVTDMIGVLIQVE